VKANAALVLATLLWGLWGIADKKAIELAHPYTVQWMYAIPYVVTLPLWYWMGASVSTAAANTSGGAFFWATVASVASIVATMVLFFAMQSKPASLAVAATSAYPLVTMALAVFSGTERFGFGKLAGVLLIVVGIVAIQLSGD
jgi:drug/metabolite transporter (DMT)-like permease